MSSDVRPELLRVLQKIDRPGSFAVSGSAATVLPGLEVKGLGPVGLPLTVGQAKDLKKLCTQAPYGKGSETVVDTSVRRVWQLKPDQFTLTNPDWEPFLKQTVRKVQDELGLEGRTLEAHLYDLLLYEQSSFFLPHRDGEKLERMVGTLVIVLPSSFEGGELVVRHDGQEQVIDFGSGTDNPYRTHFAAFYADCEHEIRPLRAGYRLCLVYNLTLKKGKKGLTAPRSSEHVEPLARILRDWTLEEGPEKLVYTLAHQYTQDGLNWDALKGVDRAQAEVLLAAAQQAGCRVSLALLTFHESGSAEYAGGYSGRRRRGWRDYDDEDEDASNYAMGEVFETSLTLEHWSDSQGQRLPYGPIGVDDDELLDPEALEAVEPEEEFEGYTGNAGMTLDRWYRHGALVLWPNRRHFEVMCGAGIQHALEDLKQLVERWQKAGKQEALSLGADCVAFATAIIERWPETHYGYCREPTACRLMPLLEKLDDPVLVRSYLTRVLPRNLGIDPGIPLARVCQRHGWGTFAGELRAVFQQTTAVSLQRNVQLLEHICLGKPHQDNERLELCRTQANTLVPVLEALDRETAGQPYYLHSLDRTALLVSLARAFLATEQFELLARVVAHALANAKQYPLTSVHVPGLTALAPWLKKQVTEPCPALNDWLAACCTQLETRTAEMPQPPADYRRAANVPCKCADCAELRRFLSDPKEPQHRFTAAQDRRTHLEHNIRQHQCDLDCKTEERGRPYTLVCTKNTASYKARLQTYHEEKGHLATLRAIEASLPN